jgi:hypothetical protein
MSSDHPIVPQPVPAAESKPPPKGFAAQVSEWHARHPVLAIWLVSLLAVASNCFPVVFCGKSYVSPVSVNGKLLYDWLPAGPGTAAAEPPNWHQHGSDTESMMWWGVPAGFIESRSLLEQHELPLWNRYSHAGDTFIGQAVSMLGDPLQLIVILGHGSAGAWDLKFLAAKFLFCAGFGWLILRLLNHRTLALIFAALAAYCGAYFYINNHPSFFVLAYAPWILLAAIEWLDLQSARPVRWGIIWLLANFCCFNAGHIEVAVDLMAGLNLAAVIHALVGYRDRASQAGILVRMGIGTLFLAGLTAPVWLSFLASLDGAFTTHAGVLVTQLPLTALPGAFDDLFYLLLRADNSTGAIGPGTSLLVLVGCGLSLSRWRQLKQEPFYWINLAAIGLWGGVIFGLVPSSLIAQVPMLNRVGHIYTDFSYLLVIHLTLQCAYGFLALTKGAKRWQWVFDFACLGGIGAGLIVLYAHGFQHHPIPWDYVLCAAAGAVGAPGLFVFLKSRAQPRWVLGWMGIIVLGFIPNYRFGLYNHGNDALLMLPGPRLVLNLPSRAVDKLKLDQSEPFRVTGLAWNFMGDYAAVYELEDIRSCAPLSNSELLNLIRSFPGVESDPAGWMVQVADPAKAQPLLNLLNVKYLLSWPDVSFRQPHAFRITDRGDFGVIENLQVWPRAFFANQIVAITSSAEFTQHLLTNSPQPFVALTPSEINKQPGLQQLATAGPAVISPATHYRLSPNATEFEVHASAPGIVCLTEGQAKDFTATANHQPKTVLTVNRAFKGIYLDQPGDYQVRFTYRPRHWRLACALFDLAAAGVILLALWRLIRLNRPRKNQTPAIH